MYTVSLFNGAVETVIHYPSADNTYPHLITIPFKEILSQPDQLSFIMLSNNPGYNLATGLTTRVKVTDTRDDSILFSGRVIPTKSNMDGGEFTKEVTCEGALAFLNDTHTRRWNLTNKTPSEALTYFLDQHNAKVDATRKIYLGTVTVTQQITIDTNYETTLGAIVSKIHNVLGGDLRVRETAGILYLDYLEAIGANNGTVIQLGYNMKDLIEEWDPSDIVTRLIPLGYGEGINQLGIEGVNGGIDYLDNAEGIATYGVIEGVTTNKDIQDAATLKVYGATYMDQKKQPRLTISASQLDLSVLAGHEGEKYGNGDTLGVLNDVMGIDVLARVIERSMDLLAPWDPALVISTRPIRLSDQIIELKQKNQSLENAPQGSTFIDTVGYAENIDATHSFQLPIWISPDIINVNRVRLHVDSQKFRAYEKSIASAASSTSTSSSGGSSTQTSSSSGNSTPTSNSSSVTTTPPGGAYDPANAVVVSTSSESPLDPHYHSLPGGLLAMAYQHTHAIGHTHSVSVPAHTHSVTVPSHTHDVTVPSHSHAIDYGIFEDTYPADMQVKINGAVIPGVVITDGGSLDMDISSYIGTPGTTYNLEVTSSRNGRVNVWVSVQAFIQIK